MHPFSRRSGKDKEVATILYFQSLTQLLSTQRKVTHGDIGLTDGG